MRRRYLTTTATALAVLLALAASAPGLAQSGNRGRAGAPPPAELHGAPGFVDFAELGVDPPGELSVRVNLYGAILRLVAEATRGEEPGFAELIEKLEGIFASVYEVPAGDRASVERRARETARRLEARGWQTVVELHDRSGDTSYLQVNTDGERILGLAVMFVEPDGTAGFINVVGDITPEEVGRLGRTFNIDALERFDGNGAEERKEEP